MALEAETLVFMKTGKNNDVLPPPPPTHNTENLDEKKMVKKILRNIQFLQICKRHIITLFTQSVLMQRNIQKEKELLSSIGKNINGLQFQK